MNGLKHLFGGKKLSWAGVVIFAIAAGVYTALMAILPQVRNTSLHTVAVSFELWIPAGLLIITNAGSNKDSALKCFVFFLISQPLVYLLQVPFSAEGWGLFRYYRYWFVWTVLCLPMGYIGYYIKKDNWWGYIILLPMIALTAYSYYQYLSCFSFCCPYYIAISVFCAAAVILYPGILFNNRRIRTAGTLISVLLIAALTVAVIADPLRYSTDLLSEVDGEDITEEYQAALADGKYGSVRIEYAGSIDACLVHADFRKRGRTELIITTPDGQTKRYDLIIEMFSYELREQ